MSYKLVELVKTLPSAKNRGIVSSPSFATMDTCRHFQWQRVRPANSLRNEYRYGSRATLVGHLLFLIGDTYPESSGRIADVLDTNKMQWTPSLVSLNLVLDGTLVLLMHSATLVDDKVLIFGVSRGENLGLRDLFAIDIGLREMSIVPTRGQNPGFTWEHSADFYEKDRRVYFFGGIDKSAATAAYDTLRVLQVDDMQWENVQVKGERPPGMFRHSSCIDNATLFIIGGLIFNQQIAMADCSTLYLMRLYARHPYYTWETVSVNGSSPGMRSGSSVVALGSGKIMLFGGVNSTGGATSTLYVLEDCQSSARKWCEVKQRAYQPYYTLTDVIPEPREGAPMVCVGKKIILLGGTSVTDDRPGHYELVRFGES